MDCIAEQTFRCHPAVGDPFVLAARFGRPEAVETGGGFAPHAVCVVSFQPLVPERRIHGGNQFQALCLALDHLRATLTVFIGEGGRVYWEDTDSLVNLSSPWLEPMPGRKVLAGQFWGTLPVVGEGTT